MRYFARLGDIPASYTLLKHTLVVFLIGRSAGVVRNAETLDAVQLLPSISATQPSMCVPEIGCT